MAPVRFAKAHALANDFLIVEELEPLAEAAPSELARAICDRQRGIGADGLILFRAGEGSGFSMRIYNRDGSEAEMSGNGLRCLGAYLKFSGRAPGATLEVDTAAGPRSLTLVGSRGPQFVFRAVMGAPRLARREILSLEGRDMEVALVSMGNPHCVVFVPRLDFDELRQLGPRLERHPLFPQRTNVELVQVRSRSEIRVGFWERGVGETQASGTGACAAAVAAMLNNKVEDKVRVTCPGGTLEVWWRDREEVQLTGDAVVIAEGEYFGATAVL